jgi:hypothetical protein
MKNEVVIQLRGWRKVLSPCKAPVVVVGSVIENIGSHIDRNMGAPDRL